MNNIENKYEKLLEKLSKAGFDGLGESIKVNEPLSTYTTMRVGGPADFLAEPGSLLEVVALFEAAQSLDLPVLVMGNGSNMVVSDRGVEGLVIRLGKALAQVWFEEDAQDDDAVLVHVFSGALLSKVALECARKGLGGLEFAAGIPGSVGGALYMNAGAYGGQMSDVVYKSVSLSAAGDMLTLTGDEHQYGYRQSYFLSHGGIIVSSILRLYPGDREQMLQTIRTLGAKRVASQPLKLPSAGSAFKRPIGNYAGTLIQETGLKGLSVGGAQVSEKHAGFIVNTGGATADDVYQLVNQVRAKVFQRSGVELEPEIRFVGRGF